MQKIRLERPKSHTNHLLHFCLLVCTILFIPPLFPIYILVWIVASLDTGRQNRNRITEGYIQSDKDNK